LRRWNGAHGYGVGDSEAAVKYELRSNAHREIRLWPENAIEKAFIESMGADASKGQPVTVSLEDAPAPGPIGLLISMEK